MENTSQQLYHTHISSRHHLLDLRLKEVWQYRDLILLFTKRSFVVRYKQTILGPAWIFLNPLFSSIIYSFVFGGIAGISTEGVPSMLFYLCSNALWLFFSTCVVSNAKTFTENANVFGKVYFPRLVMPVSTVLSSAINFVVQFAMFLLFWVYYALTGQVTPHYEGIVLLPFILLYLGLLGLGCGIIVSSLTTKYRDLAMLVTFGVQLWMYITPVVYPLSTVSEGFLRTILMINPVTCAVETFRWIFLGAGEMSGLFWGVSVAVMAAVVFVGVIIFSRVEKTFMDTV